MKIVSVVKVVETTFTLLVKLLNQSSAAYEAQMHACLDRANDLDRKAEQAREEAGLANVERVKADKLAAKINNLFN